MRRSRLRAGGANVFQQIRAKRSEAIQRGQVLLDLSIGEPRGPALDSARKAASAAVLSTDESMHAYQYNDSPAIPKFSQKFVEAHLTKGVALNDVAYLPIPAIKPIIIARIIETTEI